MGVNKLARVSGIDVVVANAGIASHGTVASRGYYLLISPAAALATTPGLEPTAKSGVEHFGNSLRARSHRLRFVASPPNDARMTPRRLTIRYSARVDRRTTTLLRDLAAEEGSSVIVRGACMEPMIASGTTVTVRARRHYFPGDVIVFRTAAGDLAAHRVLGWRPAGLVTRGDHCVIHDAPVPRQEIVGAAGVRVTVGDRIRAITAFAAIALRRLLR